MDLDRVKVGMVSYHMVGSHSFLRVSHLARYM